jgi:hypothetical protein
MKSLIPTSCPSAESASTSLHRSRVERNPLARYKHIDTSPRFIVETKASQAFFKTKGRLETVKQEKND